jgi:hypothetical protein
MHPVDGGCTAYLNLTLRNDTFLSHPFTQIESEGQGYEREKISSTSSIHMDHKQVDASIYNSLSSLSTQQLLGNEKNGFFQMTWGNL